MRGADRLYVLLLVVVLAWASPAGAKTDRFRNVRAAIREEIAAGRAPSLAVAVARRGKIVWEEAFGWADREREIPATVHTMFSLASVSKPLTATGLMVLAERQAVDLEGPINDYLGAVRLRPRRGDPNGATVRQVADHTSGLPLHHHFFADPASRPALAETIRRYGNLVTEPGERFQYSNLGYGVLEYLIEQASGQSFAAFMREEVFAPLGLEHTAVLQGPEPSPELAVRYGPDGRPLPFYGSDHGGGSAAFACAHDLVRFGQFHLRARLPDQTPVLSHRAIREMQRRSSRRPDNGTYYGIGWTIVPGGRGHDVVRHDGGMPGASATLVLVPAESLAVAVLCGTKSELPQRVAMEILAILRPRDRGVGPQAGRPAAGRGRKRPPRRFLGTWSGEVHLGERRVPMTLVVERGQGLRVRLGEKPEGKLWGAVVRDGYLTAWMGETLPAQGNDDRTQILRLSLKLRQGRLSGAVTAFSRSATELPAALSHWVDLERSGGHRSRSGNAE